ncbi:hypothetical protein AHF37_03918 [Paragonimus kellicotti]|nr:hypothetical protein AHF37_03918 [Paragonimus kellicotti]
MATTGTSYKNYIFRTVAYPIHGVDEDLSAFLRRFEDLDSIRFTRFAWLWRKEKFIHIIYDRQNQLGLCDILGCLFHRLINILLPGSKHSHLRRICALYLLYAFHGKQPMRNQVRIRVCPVSWSAIHQLACEARDDGHLDVYYV